MGTTSQKLTQEGTLASVAPGARVTIDPGLVDALGNALSIDSITLSGGFMLLSKTTTFDAQNMTNKTLTLAWTASALHSDQHNAPQALQTVVGPGGANPSGAAAENLNPLFGADIPSGTNQSLTADQCSNGYVNIATDAVARQWTLYDLPEGGDHFYAVVPAALGTVTLAGNGKNIDGSPTQALAAGVKAHLWFSAAQNQWITIGL